MDSISNVTIHLTTSGEVVMDLLLSCKESRVSPAAANVQLFPPLVSTQIRDPSGNLFTVGYQVTGMLIVPPADNTFPYNLSFNPVIADPIDIQYHPTNPQFWSVQHFGKIPYLYHWNPQPLVFRFFWI